MSRSLWLADKKTQEVAKRVFALIGSGVRTAAGLVAGLEADRELAFDQAEAQAALNNMTRRGDIKRNSRARNAEITLTEKGAERYQQLKLLAEIDSFQVAIRDKKWDNKWRVIVYDIPENEHRLRDVIRELIEQLGCKLYQRSVWIIPYDCTPQIEQMQKVYRDKTKLTLLIADRFEGDHGLVREFRL